MELSKVLDRTKVIDNPNHLMSVNATTLHDTSTGRYITSSTKGLKQVYKAIGMFDNVFVDKLRKLDQSYCEKQINAHFEKVGEEYKFFEIDNTLRVMENNKYEALIKLLKEILNQYEDAECTFSGDMLYMDSNLGSMTNNKYLAYNFINNRLDVSSYIIIDEADSVDSRSFYGVKDYKQVRLDDPGMIPPTDTYDITHYVDGSLTKVIDWNDVGKICKNLKSKDTAITLALVESTSERHSSEMSLERISQLIYKAYIESPQKMMRYIDQFSYAMANLHNPSNEETLPDNMIIVSKDLGMAYKI